MATPAGNDASNSSENVTVNAKEAAARHERFSDLIRHAEGIKPDEVDLYRKWMSLPHPELQLDSYLAWIGDIAPDAFYNPTPELEAEVAAAITEEQEARFKRVAETRDIESVYIRLQNFKTFMEEIEGVLEAEKEDSLADFNAEDFKRIEKEDQRFREQKLKDKKQNKNC